MKSPTDSPNIVEVMRRFITLDRAALSMSGEGEKTGSALHTCMKLKHARKAIMLVESGADVFANDEAC